MSDQPVGRIEKGPEPDPDAPPHGDWEPDDNVDDDDDPGDPDAEPVNMYTDEDRETYFIDTGTGL